MKIFLKRLFCFIIIITFALIVSFFLKDELNKKDLSLDENVNNAIINSKDIQLEEAYVTKIVDGDTIWVKLGNTEEKVRLIGIDCPEYTKQIEPYGKEATEYTTEKLLNKMVFLQKDVSNTDNYDRLLRYVWTEKIYEVNDENISKYLFNYSLCNEGLAESKYYNPNISFQNYLDAAQKYAKDNKKGMWNN